MGPRILEMLVGAGARFKGVLEHVPTLTSEESARVRGDLLANGAKAIVVICDTARGRQTVLVVFSAARRLDSKKLKVVLKAKALRFARPEEISNLSLTIGGVPPFGVPIVQADALVVDTSITSLTHISFNNGSLDESVIGLNVADYLRVAKPSLIAAFTVASEEAT